VKRRGNAPEGDVSVSGPGYERDGLPNVSVGISAALTVASRSSEGTWYVRDGDVMKAHVTAHAGVVEVFPVRKAAGR
jgi:hypothetical protein